MLPGVGERITAFFEGVLACGTVHATEGQLISWSPVEAIRRRNVDAADEGITWIRGWHVEGSDEINALRAAKKLRDSARPLTLAFSPNTPTAALRGLRVPCDETGQPAAPLPCVPTATDEFWLDR